MKNFNEQERQCQRAFARLGEIFHLWTPENFEIIFTCDEDFKAGMGIIGICAKLFSDVIIITFELMTNHIHITAAGTQERINEMFAHIRQMLIKLFEGQGRHIDWTKFTAGLRKINSLEDARNVIAYDNRNGFIVCPDHTPYSYPWGANRFYFNNDAKELANEHSMNMTVRSIRALSHSRMADGIKGLKSYDGYALPLSFCDIGTGEQLFRDATHYFNKISKNIECSREIAREIGESVYYTDDELFNALCKICNEKYGSPTPSLLPTQAKLELAKTLHYEYNASAKQIQRMLKLNYDTVAALGF